MPPKIRIEYWKSDPGQDGIVFAKSLIEPVIAEILHAGGLKYDSVDMLNGINTSQLAEPHQAAIIKQMVVIDPRGGFMSQKDR